MTNNFVKIGTQSSGDQVRSFIESQASSDIYFRVCSIKPDWRPSKADWRGSVPNTFAIPGFYADIDIANTEIKRKKSNLPTSFEIVDECLANLKFAPTYIVNSGGGLHLYWLFLTPWIFADAEERAHAQALSRNWFRTIVKPAFDGYDLDNVSDLARILRLPGSVNQKYENLSRRLERDDLDETRYDLAEITEILDPTLTAEDRQWDSKILNPTSYTPRQNVVATDIKLSTETQKIVREIKSERPKFAKTWNKHRDDLFDDSASTYELALIMLALSYDDKLSNETLIEMCAWWRQVHKFESRVDSRGNVRIDQYVNEIAKARVSVSVDKQRVEDWDAALGHSDDNQNDDLLVSETQAEKIPLSSKYVPKRSILSKSKRRRSTRKVQQLSQSFRDLGSDRQRRNARKIRSLR